MSVAWKPSGVLAIEDAVISLAEFLSPTAGVAKYLSDPAPCSPAAMASRDPIAIALASWDPFEQPRESAADPP